MIRQQIGCLRFPKHCTLWFFLLSSFFFRRLISEVTERISTKLGHIFTYDCYLKKLAWTPLGVYPPRARGKNRFFGIDLELRLNISLQQNIISTIGKKHANLQGLPYVPPPTLVNFGPDTAQNGWRVFTNPLNFRTGRHCKPYRMHVI